MQVCQAYLSEWNSRDVNDGCLLDDSNLCFPNMFPSLVRLRQQQEAIPTVKPSDRCHRSQKSDYFVRMKVFDCFGQA